MTNLVWQISVPKGNILCDELRGILRRTYSANPISLLLTKNDLLMLRAIYETSPLSNVRDEVVLLKNLIEKHKEVILSEEKEE